MPRAALQLGLSDTLAAVSRHLVSYIGTTNIFGHSRGVSVVNVASSMGAKAVQCRINQDADDRLAALCDALTAVQDQLAGQSSSLGELKAAEAEVRRLLADKAGLADVQAVLQAHSAPTLVPVSTHTCYTM